MKNMLRNRIEKQIPGRKRIQKAILAVLALFVLLAGVLANEVPVEAKTYQSGSVYTLKGTVKKRSFTHAGNGQKVVVYTLKLDQKITVDDSYWGTQETDEVDLNCTNSTLEKKVKKYKGKKVQVKGEVFCELNAWHPNPATITVQSIKKQTAQTKEAFYYGYRVVSEEAAALNITKISKQNGKLFLKGKFAKAKTFQAYLDGDYTKLQDKSFSVAADCKYYISGGKGDAKKLSQSAFLKEANKDWQYGVTLTFQTNASGKIYYMNLDTSM